MIVALLFLWPLAPREWKGEEGERTDGSERQNVGSEEQTKGRGQRTEGGQQRTEGGE